MIPGCPRVNGCLAPGPDTASREPGDLTGGQGVTADDNTDGLGCVYQPQMPNECWVAPPLAAHWWLTQEAEEAGSECGGSPQT